VNKSSAINKIIENQIHNNHVAESFFTSLSSLGIEADKIENRFRFDIYPICEFFSIPAGWHLKPAGEKTPLNWEIIESCSILIGFIYPTDYMKNLLLFLQNLQKKFLTKSISKKDGPSSISNEFFQLFSFEEVNQRIALSVNPLVANVYKNNIVNHLQNLESSNIKRGLE